MQKWGVEKWRTVSATREFSRVGSAKLKDLFKSLVANKLLQLDS